MNSYLHRRDWLQSIGTGFGGVALAGLLGGRAEAAGSPFAARAPHFAAKADRIIFLYMDGGPSQVDTFDPKPRLTKENGQPFKMKKEPTQFNNNGNTLGSPWKFAQHGKSGLPVSELFPHVAKHADELCVVRSMVANFSEHTNANYFLHTGNGQQGRPSFGSWVTYGLGSESQELPGFVVLGDGMIPPGGVDCFGNGFLPAAYQGSMFRHGNQPVADLTPPPGTAEKQAKQLARLRKLDAGFRDRLAASGTPTDALDAAIANAELAARMQLAVPAVYDLSKETRLTKTAYGLNDAATQTFGTQCLIARRLAERGVRFIEVLCKSVGHDRWDQHANLKKGHEDNARAVDQPIGALLADLKARGMLERTLVLWAGEFGRTPFAQGSDGRDHNPFGFSIWVAGGGVAAGTAFGATDEYGYHAIENKVTMHDLHATLLHQMGLEHTKLTVRFGGRDMRLTDVHGELVHGMLRT